MAEMAPAPEFVTYSLLPSGLRAKSSGSSATSVDDLKRCGFDGYHFAGTEIADEKEAPVAIGEKLNRILPDPDAGNLAGTSGYRTRIRRSRVGWR